MNPTNSRVWLIALGVAIAQAAFLGWMVWDRVNLIRNGAEIVLNTTPIDPRSLFRGDYVILNYADASRLQSPLLTVQPEPKSSICVLFEKAPDGEIWKPVATAKSCPEKSEKGQVAVKGKVRSSNNRNNEITAVVNYGIESYFVPENTGKALEQQIAKGAIQALVAVDRKGRAAIKGLIVNGTRIYDEPLW